MKNTIVVNLIAAPSSGKSTIMANVFSELKWRGIDCEMATEFAKDLVWEERKGTFENQVYIFGKQSHRIFRLNVKVDVVITDSPIILTQYYNNGANPELDKLCLKEFNKYNNLNYYIKRCKPYNPNGRNQTEEESDQIALELKQLLDMDNIPYRYIEGKKENVKLIVNDILELLKAE